MKCLDAPIAPKNIVSIIRGGIGMDIEVLRSDERYRIANMSDEEAVDILRKFLKHGQFMMGRGNGKMTGH